MKESGGFGFDESMPDVEVSRDRAGVVPPTKDECRTPRVSGTVSVYARSGCMRMSSARRMISLRRLTSCIPTSRSSSWPSESTRSISRVRVKDEYMRYEVNAGVRTNKEEM